MYARCVYTDVYEFRAHDMLVCVSVCELTCWKQLRTLGSMLEPPKAATSPSCLGTWMASWSSRPSCLWSHVSPADATWLKRSEEWGEGRDKKEGVSERVNAWMWVIFRIKDIGINRWRGRKCDIIAQSGRESVTVCMYGWAVVVRTQNKSEKRRIFNPTVLILACQILPPLISLSVSLSLSLHPSNSPPHHPRDWQSCYWIWMPARWHAGSGQLTPYISDEVLEHLQGFMQKLSKLSKESRDDNPLKEERGSEGNEGHETSFCSACSRLWSLCDDWPRCQLLLSVCVCLCVWYIQMPAMTHVCDPLPTHTPRVVWLINAHVSNSRPLPQNHIWHAQLTQKECGMASRPV